MAQAKTLISDFTIRLGLVTIPGSLTPTTLDRSSRATSLKLVCPTCAESVKKGRKTIPGIASVGTQRYVCTTNEDHVFTSAEARRAKEVSKNLELLTPEQVKALKDGDEEAGVPDNTLDLIASPTGPMEPFFVPSGSSYHFIPSRAAQPAWAVLCALLKPDLTLHGVARIKNAERWVRLALAEDGNLVLEGLVWPEQIADAPAVLDRSYDERMFGMALTLVDQITEPFDPQAIRSSARRRHEEIVAQLSVGRPVPEVASPAKVAAPAADALEAMLQESLKQKKKAK